MLENPITFRFTEDIVKTKPKELTMKVVRGVRGHPDSVDIWKRFDRLQQSLRPLRVGKRPKRGVRYGQGT